LAGNSIRPYVKVTLRTPLNELGGIIETTRTLGKDVAVYGKLPKRSNPGVLVDTFRTVQGTLPPGPGNPHEMNGIPPPGGG